MKNLKFKDKLFKLFIAGNIVLVISSTVGLIKTTGKTSATTRFPLIQQDDVVSAKEDDDLIIEDTIQVVDGTEVQSQETISSQNMGYTYPDQSPGYVVGQEEVTAQNTSGTITFTENIVNLSKDVSLINNYGYILEGNVNDIKAFNQDFQIVGICGRAVTLTELNIRKGPGTSYDKLETMRNGTTVSIYGRTSDNWYLINYNGIVGFVSGDYIQLLDVNYDDANNVIYSVIPQAELAIEPTTVLNVRDGNSTDYNKIGQISGNRKYKVIEKCSNGWYHIDYNGKDGYVSGDYVNETYMLFGDFYRFVYLQNDTYLYDGDGFQKRVVSKYEGGKVYSEDETRYLVSLGDDYGYINKSDCKVIDGKVINIDLSLQQLEIISDGKVILTTDIVSGKDSTPSDEGLFTINMIKKQTYLVGPGYRTYVNYFGPYNGGEGIHDAEWQHGHFGDVDYYHTGGSHGCINMPPEITPEVFDNVDKGTLVLVHK